MKKIKICIIVTDPINLFSLYRDQFKYLQENGFDITAVASAGIEHVLLKNKGIKTKVIHMKKQPSPVSDLVSLMKLTIYFMINRFDIISISTPKASLLGGIASFLTLQRNIIYTIRGRAYEHKKGLELNFYHNIEKFLCSISKKVFCISYELKDSFIDLGLCNKEKIFVIGSGSSNGVDLTKFSKTQKCLNLGNILRAKYSIQESDIVILNSGRMRKDKGINELIYAFKKMKKKNIHLVLQGKFEDIDLLDDEALNIIQSYPNIYTFEWEQDIEKYFCMADIFAFPSHREGFGNVALEASAMELPVLAFDVIGVRESVQDGVSGILVEEVNVDKYHKALEKLCFDKELRIKLGKQGRNRIEAEFDSKYIWQELVKVYKKMMQ